MIFAKIDIFNKVLKAIVAEQDFIDLQPGQWVPCEGIKNDPVIGYTFDVNRMAFVAPKPFDSWTFNETTCQWEAPVARPDSPTNMWDETTKSWVPKT